MRQRDVAGIAQRLAGGLRAVTDGLPARKRLVTSLEVLVPAAVVARLCRKRAAVQPRRQRDELEGRAGLIAVGHAAVAPLL